MFFPGLNKILITIIGIALIGCANKETKEKINIEKNLFTFFQETVHGDDSTLNVDSVRIIKLDTLTQRDKLDEIISQIYKEVTDNGVIIDGDLSINHSKIQLAKLYAGLDHTLYENYMDEARTDLAKIRELAIKDSLLIEQAKSYKALRDKSDSITLVNYQVKCLVQCHRKDLSIRRDTLFAFLTPEKNIMQRRDVFKR